MAVTSFQDLPLADRDHDWDGDAAEKRVREWAGAEDEPNEKYRDAHVWYDADKKDNSRSTTRRWAKRRLGSATDGTRQSLRCRC